MKQIKMGILFKFIRNCGQNCFNIIVLEDENRRCEVYFIVVEVARLLGHKNGAVRRNCLNPIKFEALERNEGCVISSLFDSILIDKFDVYALILYSELPLAQDFKRWFSAEALKLSEELLF